MPSNIQSPTFNQRTLFQDERGLSTVEYVIILVLIAAAALVSWQLFGATILAKIHDSDVAISTMQGLEAGTAADGSGNSGKTEAATSSTPAASREFVKVDD